MISVDGKAKSLEWLKSILKIGLWLSAADLITVLWTGGYRLPVLSIHSQFPCTSLFLLLLAVTGLQCLFYYCDPSPSEGRLNFIFFLSVWMVYLVNFRWRGSGDCVPASLQPFALLQHGNFFLERYFTGSIDAASGVYWHHHHLISKYPSAAGVLLLPFYGLTALAQVAPTDLLIHQLQKIGASCLVALSAWCLLVLLSQWVSRFWAILLAVGYALGTESWSTSSQGIWQHGPSQLFIALGLYAFLNRTSAKTIAYGGLAFGLAVCARYSDLFIYAAAFAYVAGYHRDHLKRFILFSIAPFVLLLVDNYFHSGSFFHTGYPSSETFDTFTGHAAIGILGLLVSPGRGIVFFCPLLLYGLAGLAYSLRRSEYMTLRFLSLGVVATFLFYGQYTFWSGGWCYGPRYLADIGPVVIFGMVPLVPWLERNFIRRIAFYFALGFSLIAQAIGVFFTWWWETPPTNVWSFSNNPFVFLCRAMSRHDNSGQTAAAWTWLSLVTTLVIVLFVCYLYNRRSTTPSSSVPARTALYPKKRG